jgi:hypothetical protein
LDSFILPRIPRIRPIHGGLGFETQSSSLDIAIGSAHHAAKGKPMNTAHEVLQEIKTAADRTQEEQKRWAKLKGWANAPKRIGLVLFFFALYMLCPSPSHFNDSKLWFILFLSFISLLLVGQQRRNKMLIEIIQQEAPGLHQKLKTKGIAD